MTTARAPFWFAAPDKVAHDEQASLGNALNALLAQTRVPDCIVALADNCTEQTEQVARRFEPCSELSSTGHVNDPAGWMRPPDPVGVDLAARGPDRLAAAAAEIVDPYSNVRLGSGNLFE